MSTLLFLFDKALDLTAAFLSATRNSKSPDDLPAQNYNLDLMVAIDSVAIQIDRVADDVVNKVEKALERAQLEKLSSQAKGVKLAMEFGNEGMLGQAVMGISELTEYSTARIGEGKYEWLGPWMAAETIRIEGLRMLAKNERAAAVVSGEIRKFRVNILNHVGTLLVQSHPSPWLEIADFVEGRNDDVLRLVRQIQTLRIGDGKPVIKTVKKAIATKRIASTAVKAAPVTVWPFPTSTKC